ncbi:MAG TPA: hypothetical protein VMV21_12815 [Vicinamibacteria bacterium]|nr:hypothetical protein [Vicinamibacteria bacterium]
MSLTVAALAFAAAAGLSATVGGLTAGSITTGVAVPSLALGVVAALLAARATAAVAPHGQGHLMKGEGLVLAAAWLTLLLAGLRQFLWLGVSDGTSVSQLNPYDYGDLPLHWSYVRFFAEGASFWPQNPIFTGTRLGYPIGSDLLAALFVKLGADPAVVFRSTGIVATVALGVALRRWGGGLAMAAFVLSGGCALSRFAPGALLRADDSDLAWKNLLLALFVPQRGFLFALPAGLLFLWSAREKLLRDRSGLPSWVEGLLWGALPLFHVHTFLVVSVVYGLWAIGGRRQLQAALPTVLVAVPLATFGLWQVTDGFAAARVVWWKPGWMIGGDNPLVFLLLNFGLLPPLAIAMLIRPPRDDARAARLTLAPALGLFALFFFLMLAPWEWDNTKAFIWCVLLMLGPLSAWLAERPRAVGAILGALVLLPGLPAALGGFLASKPLDIFEEAELSAVCAALKGVPADARIATVQTFNHPVGLCGRALVAGYGGHLWSHGLRAEPVQERLARLMKGEPDWQADARALGARYVFWGPREARAFPFSTRPWAEAGRLRAATPYGELFALD